VPIHAHCYLGVTLPTYLRGERKQGRYSGQGVGPVDQPAINPAIPHAITRRLRKAMQPGEVTLAHDTAVTGGHVPPQRLHIVVTTAALYLVARGRISDPRYARLPRRRTVLRIPIADIGWINDGAGVTRVWRRGLTGYIALPWMLRADHPDRAAVDHLLTQWQQYRDRNPELGWEPPE
jgi:hypothetical protein